MVTEGTIVSLSTTINYLSYNKTEEINKRLDELYVDYDEAEQLLSSMNVQE